MTQFDTLVPILTVEEMLAYTAELKLPVALAKADKAAAVEGVIRALGLESCRSVLIGTAAARGVSGGQAKRVNIGIALVSNPRVLFLDEPTTGLDSFTQNEVMQVVASLSRGGITTVCTIHSPTATAFALFDRLVLLLEGKCVYTGKAGEAAVRYLCALPKPPPAPAPGASHAEWITDFTVSASRAARGPELAAAYACSGAAKAAAAEAAALMALEAGALDAGSAAALKTRSQTATPMWHAIATLARYRMRKNYASGSFLGARIGTWFFQTFVLVRTRNETIKQRCAKTTDQPSDRPPHQPLTARLLLLRRRRRPSGPWRRTSPARRSPTCRASSSSGAPRPSSARRPTSPRS